jgi:hypothetical protein
MIINCKATPLVGKADAFDLPSTQGSPAFFAYFFSCSKKVG